jgi:hypothetical protein
VKVETECRHRGSSAAADHEKNWKQDWKLRRPVAQLAAKEVIAELRPWIEQEKAEHIGRPVNIAKRGLQRIERLWDQNAVPEARTESLAAATPDKHDQIIRRNLGLNDAAPSAGALSLNILTNHSLVQVAASAPAAPSPDE